MFTYYFFLSICMPPRFPVVPMTHFEQFLGPFFEKSSSESFGLAGDVNSVTDVETKPNSL